jgi:hypothetical protein
LRIRSSRFAAVCAPWSPSCDHGRRKHPDYDGFRAPAAIHIDRAIRHLELLKAGDATEQHLEHAAMRLLMAIKRERS